jgi:hypoxanthine phosphoribosyltransferase
MPMNMQKGAKVPDRLTELISKEAVAERVAELAERISSDFPDGDLLVVGVLKGAFVFLADLIRRLRIPTTIDFLRVASYGTDTDTSGVVEIRKDVELPVTGRNVLLVEDIVDTGLTVDYLVGHLKSRNPESVRVCALLDKPSRRKVDLKIDYVGFEIADHFVVGYGLDCNEKYRFLPGVSIVEPDVES